MPNDLPIFAGCDSYGTFSVILNGKRYDFPHTDAASHERWRNMLSSKNPKFRWKAFQQIKMSNQPKPTVTPDRQLTFKSWMNS